MLYRKKRKYILFICILLALTLCITACKQKDKTSETNQSGQTEGTSDPSKEETNEGTVALNKDEVNEESVDSNKEETNEGTMNKDETETKNENENSATVTPGTEKSDFFSTIDLDTVSLKDIYKDQFLIGTIYTSNITIGDDYALVVRNFNAITPENLMKPEYMQPAEGNFNYASSDIMVKFAEDNNLTTIGHTLAWHQQSGNWLGKNVDRDTAIEQLRSHITNIVEQYKGRIYAWDVVNEAVNDGVSLPSDGDWTKCLRSTQWLTSIGPDYLALAFQFAHEADPDAKLYYNDYNMNVPAKANIVHAMVADLRAQGVPIHGIGMQGHYNTETMIPSVEKSIDLFSTIEGIEISITELDVGVNDAVNNQLTKEQEKEQAIFYANLFVLFKKHADVIDRVTFWGYRDNTSWRSENCPLLFNYRLEPKESFFAVLYPEEYLAANELEKAEKAAKQAVAYFGSPTIDGAIDDVWNKATLYPINKQVTAWEGATGTVRLLWDTSYLYALYEVKDSLLNQSSPNAYEHDSIELFLDQNLSGLGYYDDGTGQYRVNYEGTLSFGEVPTQDGVLAAAQTTSEGYTVEIAIPLLKVGTKGRRMGFEAQINDSNASGIRQSIAKFSDQSDNSWQSTENWGEVLFK